MLARGIRDPRPRPLSAPRSPLPATPWSSGGLDGNPFGAAGWAAGSTGSVFRVAFGNGFHAMTSSRESAASRETGPAEVRLGSILVSFLEPERGREAEFHRWYERDHFYSGCMVGEHFFAGRRFVSTRPLKDERLPAEGGLLTDVRDGSYLALYWLLAGHHEEARDWAVRRVQSLIAHDRMMPGRKAVHAGFYLMAGVHARDEDDVPAELALDHPFEGVGLTLLEATAEGEGSVARDSLIADLLSRDLPETMASHAASLCLVLTAEALPDDAPGYVDREAGLDRRVLLVSFYKDSPMTSMRAWTEELVSRLEAKGTASLQLAAPFIPTIAGTDRYTDELW